jgi:hypothetical protein
MLPSPYPERLGFRIFLVTRISRRSYPAARRIASPSEMEFVRRLRIRLSPATRPLSFMVETLAMVGLPPTRLVPASLVMPGYTEDVPISIIRG